MTENVPYWADNVPADSNAAIPPHWAWSMGQQAAVAAAEPADLIQNPDGSASATLTVPNNVSHNLMSVTCMSVYVIMYLMFCESRWPGPLSEKGDPGSELCEKIPAPTSASKTDQAVDLIEKLW